MSYKIFITDEFSKNVKKLSKRFKHIKNDLKNLKEELQNGKMGTFIGNNCYKKRLPNSSSNKGKSGGFRVICYLQLNDKIFLLSIYSKSDMENIEETKLLQIIKDNGL